MELLETKAPMSIWDYLIPWVVSPLLVPRHEQYGQSLPGKTFSSFLVLDIAHHQMNLAANNPSSWDFLVW